jgi:hypothetical protein
VEHPRKSRPRGRRAGSTITLAATAAFALALVGAGAASTPVVTVGPLGAVASVASPSTVAVAASLGQTTIGVGPGAGVVVCHVGAAANVLGIPVVVRVSEIRAFLLANPNDYLGTCGASSRRGGGAGDASANAEVGATDDAVAAGDAGAPSRPAGAGSAPAGAVPCGERLVIGSVQVAPLVIRSPRQPVLLRLVVRTGCGDAVRNALVTLQSTPLGKIAGTVAQRTAADGSVVFASTTTKRLRLVRGGRLVLLARATRPSQAVAGCTTGHRLVSATLVSVRTAKPTG